MGPRMLVVGIFLTLIGAIILTPVGYAQPSTSQDDSAGALIQQLESKNLDERERAQEALVKLGAPAVEPLIGFVDTNRDHDAGLRTRDALVKIGEPAIRALLRQLDYAEGKHFGKIGNRLLPRFGRAAVDPLIGVLGDENRDIRLGAIQVLGEIGDGRAVEPLCALLGDGDKQVVGEALRSLKQIRDPRAIPSLVGLLRDKRSTIAALVSFGPAAVDPLLGFLRDGDPHVRAAAVSALGDIRDPRATRPILTMLKDPHEHGLVKQAALYAIARLEGPRAAGVIAPFLKSQSRDLRRTALYVLDQVHYPQVVNRLVALAKHDPSMSIRAWGIYLLRGKKSSAATEVVIASLKDRDRGVRLAAREAVEYLRDPGAVGHLSHILRTGDWELRLRAVQALGHMGEAATQSLVLATKDSNPRVRREAIYTLSSSDDPKAFAILVAALKDRDSQVRACAAERLVYRKDTPAALSSLLAALHDADPRVRTGVAAALGRTSDARIVTPLIERLLDEDTDVRRAAAFALAPTGDSRAVDALIAALNDRRQIVTKHADPQSYLRVAYVPPTGDYTVDCRPMIAEALGRSRDSKAVEPLIAVLGDENSFMSQRSAESLGKLGDGRAVDPVIHRLRDTNPDVRASAATALGEIGDPRAAEPIKRMLNDVYQPAREAAESALKKLRK